MGCSSASNRSKLATNEFYQEARGFEKKKENGQALEKVRGKSCIKIGGSGKNTFYEECIGHADEAGAVKPWLENMVSPEYELHEDTDTPKYKLSIEHIYGYRVEDCRQNLFFFGKEELLYMSGSLGIIQNLDDYSQTLFGGFANKEDDCHDNDIIALTYYKGNVSMVATGQRGIKPLILVWSPYDTSVVYAKFNLPKGSKEVSSLEFDKDGHYLMAIGKDDQNSVFIFDIQKKTMIFQKPTNEYKTDIPEFLMDMANSEEKPEFCLVGVNKVFFCVVDSNVQTMSENIIKTTDPDDIVIYTCCEYVNDDLCLVGSESGELLKFGNSKERTKYSTQKVSSYGIQTITCFNTGEKKREKNGTMSYKYEGKIFISDSNCTVFILDEKKLEKIDSFYMESVVRSLDINDDEEIVMGLKNGSIVIMNYKNNKRQDLFLKSHCVGSIRGLDYVPDNRVITTGDDNRIMVWNLRSKKCESEGQINEPEQIQDLQNKNIFHTHPKNKSKCVSYNKEKGHIAVGLDDGTITIREGTKKLETKVLSEDIVLEQPKTVKKKIKHNEDNEEEVEDTEYLAVTDLKYTSYGDLLCATTEGGLVSVMDVNQEYANICEYRVNINEYGYILNFDFDSGTKYIQAVTSKNKFIFIELFPEDKEPKLIKEAKTIEKMDFPSVTCKFGYTVQGVYMGSTDPNFISSVCKAHSKKLVFSGDDDKFLNLYNYPCISDNQKVKSFKGHAGHIRKIIVTPDDEKVITIADDDKAIILWNVVAC
ncbi:MAG: hypothetical protein MJ252_24210 [archaeon]|nr:hypothetical protein [archaeon]